MKLKLENTGPVNRADIDINRINVVGGVNTSGKSIISKLLYCCLKSRIDDESIDFLMDSEGLKSFKDSDIVFDGDVIPSDVFYIDNISILDLKDLEILRLDHIVHMKEALERDDNAPSSKTSQILSKIQNIINSDCLNLTGISSGIKEIGVIQALLKNSSLKENSFLIIDEPESNLHPEWQIRFAHVLVLLAKELNITLYLNSHSPMFIEAVSLYSQYYDLTDKTSFYLTEKYDDGYIFKKINPKNMGAVYENLTRPYDELDKLKAKIIFKE
ncbi:AAA family ATPase [Methanobrevibacter sp.]|uniref:AAA family ATPase n=1 Tax=Methanobrevibacter sp. TaxID=66852 RepID=UPI0026DF87AD|nr:AAA family ATPase [Methanobrevibacter sp.]MDO5859864.1 AAA family ATPase [Methanobrevibacter sp.]